MRYDYQVRNEAPRETARRRMNNLSGVITRFNQGTGRNHRSSCEAARGNFALALAAIVKVEDAEGVEAAAKLSDRLTTLRQRAMNVGLLSAADVSEIERQVCA